MSNPLMASDNKALAVATGALVVGTIAGFYLGRITTSAPHRQTPYKVDLTDSESPVREARGLVNDEEYKLVLVIRTDLGMTKGKIVAQAAHATLACYKSLLKENKQILKRWEALGQPKISVQIKSEEELVILQAQSLSLGLCAKVIHDAGRTQIASGSATVLGVGPGPKSVVDQVTGGLKLL